MDDHVVGALEEGGIDRANRAQVTRGQAGSEQGGVLFRDADVMVLPRQRLLQLAKAGAGRHGSGDADDLCVRLRLADQQGPKDILPGFRRTRLAGSQAVAGFRVERTRAVELLGVLQRRAKAAAFLGAHVQEHRPLGVLAEAQVLLKRRQVVPIDRPDVADAVLLEEGRVARVPVLDVPLEAAAEVQELRAHARAAEEALESLLRLVVGARDDQLVEDVRDGADVAVDRPLVVVEDDDEALRGVSRVVERFHRDPAGQGGVADEGDHMRVLGQPVARVGQTDGGGQGRASMARAEDVVQAFLAVEEPGEPPGRADTVEVGAVAAGEEFVDVTLVGDVEDELVLRRPEDAVQRDGQLHDAEIRADMAAVLRRDGDEALTDLLSERGQLVRRQGLDVLRTADLGKQRHRSALLRVARLLAELLDAQFGRLQAGLAGLQQAHALLVLGHELIERDRAGLQRVDELLKLRHLGFKRLLAGGRAGFFVRAHGR